MFTLSALSNLLTCYTWDWGEGSRCRVGRDNTALFFLIIFWFFLANTYLEWCEQPEKNLQYKKTKAVSLEKIIIKKEIDLHLANIHPQKMNDDNNIK